MVLTPGCNNQEVSALRPRPEASWAWLPSHNLARKPGMLRNAGRRWDPGRRLDAASEGRTMGNSRLQAKTASKPGHRKKQKQGF